MRIVIQNEYGRFEAGSSRRFAIHITDIAGIGLLSKEVTGVSFAGQPGRTVTAVRDTERTITIAFEIYGGAREIEKIYRCIYHPVDIIFFLNDRRRRISGRCVNAADAEKIIYHRLNKLVLQFVCDDPYFHDVNNTVLPLMTKVDYFPNDLQDGNWYVSLPAVATANTNAASIYNSGDTILYPIIYLDGTDNTSYSSDNEQIIINNLTTGKSIVINTGIKPGDEIVIDLPRRKLLSRLEGNIITRISDDTVLSEFYLQQGKNLLTIECVNNPNMLITTIEYNNNYIAAVI